MVGQIAKDALTLFAKLPQANQAAARENFFKGFAKAASTLLDGDNAVVTVQIEVLDYRKSISSLNTSNTNYDILEYNDEKLDILENVTDKVAYTLEINVIKDDNGNWKISSLSSDDIKKIQGMY